MPALNEEMLAICLWILPGFVASLILDHVTARRDRPAISRLFEALAFTCIIYFIVHITTGLVIQSQEGDRVAWENPWVAIYVAIVTVLSPLLVGASITYDLHMSILRTLRLTRRTSRESVWFDVFTDMSGRYVCVNKKDGRRVWGWPMYYSNSPDEGYVYLWRPYWIDENGDPFSCVRHGILLKREDIESIEFDWNKEERDAEQKRQAERAASEEGVQPTAEESPESV